MAAAPMKSTTSHGSTGGRRSTRSSGPASSAFMGIGRDTSEPAVLPDGSACFAEPIVPEPILGHAEASLEAPGAGGRFVANRAGPGQTVGEFAPRGGVGRRQGGRPVVVVRSAFG